jgi:hypothetical protein
LPEEFLNIKPATVLLSIMLEQRYLIKFFVKEENSPKEIHRRSKAGYGDGAMKRKQVDL